MAATLTAPRIPQTAAPVVGVPLEVTAEQHADGRLTITMDAGTASAVLDALRTAATVRDAEYRTNGREWFGSTGHRLRTVDDATTVARGWSVVTYDLD